MDLADVVQTKEFLAALFGVVAGFFFTLLSDVARAFVRRALKRGQIKKEVSMIKEDALSGIRRYIENDKIRRGSKEAPIMHAALDHEVISDKDMLLEAGISIRQRKALRSIKNLNDAIEREYDRMKESVLEFEPKGMWQSSNTNLCHYFAYIVFLCDEFCGRVEVDLKDPLNGAEFHERNEAVLSQVEKTYGVQIPREKISPHMAG